MSTENNCLCGALIIVTGRKEAGSYVQTKTFNQMLGKQRKGEGNLI